MKLKQCKGECKQELPISSFTSTRAKYCYSCKRIRSLKQAHDMQERALTRLRSKKPKTVAIVRLSDYKHTVQKVVNKWIRNRDKDKGCISCGNHNASSYEAGHYIPQGSSGFLRYHPDNIHLQCRACNHFKSGNLIEYRIALVKKIGVKKVEWLENNRHKTHKWTREELEELLQKYK